MTNEELIAEARTMTACQCVDEPLQECGVHGDDYARTMHGLADALEAATVEPEWGWGLRGIENTNLAASRVEAEHRVEVWNRSADGRPAELRARRRAGAWEPVGGDDA